MKNIALVGVGPHAKRIYLNYFKKHKVNLALVVELDSLKDVTKEYLKENGFKNTKVFTIDDKYKDKEHLPKSISSNLLAVCNTLEITHIIVATEPKAHFMYLEFALKNNINVLTDKPISVTKNMTSLNSIEKVRKQYYKILELANNSKASCKVMCQRKYHKGYEKIKEVLTEVVNKYQMPITNIDIFHSDGAWEMPHDMLKENHPYKYGYGKLFHSGYHFIDLLSDFIKINNSLDGNKRIVKADAYSKVFTPNDEMNILNIEDYKRIFQDQNIPDCYIENLKPRFDKYGEKDYHGLLTFYNKNNFTITSANLNLLHNGVSMRNWIETKPFYKSNGRIRHERINIEIGHLLNIQVHSYQSKEINERTDSEEQIGGLEHFDIYFFSNPLVDKVPFKEILLGDLYTKKEKKEFLGYNELSREVFLTNFLNDKDCKGDIKDQALSIEILYSCSKGIHNYYNKANAVETININNKYCYPFDITKLKKYSKILYKDLEKELKEYITIYKDNYEMSVVQNYIPNLKIYETYINIDDNKTSINGLLRKEIKNITISRIYFNLLLWLIKNINFNYLEKLIRKTYK